MRNAPFVITVASEKGGVGKTTIATNLAVYLKALREDLPVTIASFDNHFSVDNMFAIGRHPGHSVAAFFGAEPAEELVTLGEYGVQYFTSERNLTPPDDDHRTLDHALLRSELDGILILDTRPILDYFTRSALLAADLALVPIKDRPSLVNAASLHAVLSADGADPAALWIIPSLIDARLKLRENVGMHEFLVDSARERDYQVIDAFIPKSPKVESLTTNFASRVYPVLTHARSTSAHLQFKALADFVLERFDAAPAKCAPAPDLSGRQRRLLLECPGCAQQATGDEGIFWHDLRSRQRGFIHPDCFWSLFSDIELETEAAPEMHLVLRVEGAGLFGGATEYHLHLFSAAGEELCRNQLPEKDRLLAVLRSVTGRVPTEFYREVITFHLTGKPPRNGLHDPEYRRLGTLRRQLTRTVLEREK
ncbi:MAG: ParA family protein [Desulfuromonadales bacterium]|nr:ParA family protein [Desulfuromonadales bacterium]